ncbi:MAG: hypothetical protein WDM90_00410 [Ferruginibacter sp.]
MSFNINGLNQRAQKKLSTHLTGSKKVVNPTDILLENNRQGVKEIKKNETNAFDIFLCHTSEDSEIILGVLEHLNSYGYIVYVDWITDSNLNKGNITKKTIDILRMRMTQSKCLFYATTKNYAESIWMPWELGYMDGNKGRVSILPIFKDEVSANDNYEGQEYLNAYPFCVEDIDDGTNKNKLWICEDTNTYVSFDNWLKGKKPFNH